MQPNFYIPVQAVQFVDEILAKCEELCALADDPENKVLDVLGLSAAEVTPLAAFFTLVELLPYKWFGVDPFQHNYQVVCEHEIVDRYFVEFSPKFASASVTPEVKRRELPERLGIALYRCQNRNESRYSRWHGSYMVFRRLRHQLVAYFASCEVSPYDNTADGKALTDKGREFREMHLDWEEIEISFVSNDCVRVAARGTSRQYHFAELDFTDSRKGDQPDSRWKDLRIMAKLGEISFRTPVDTATQGRVKASVKDIRRRLKTFFGITTDPFLDYRKAGGYIPKFKLYDKRYGGQGDPSLTD